ncbi:MAG: hypothetical protein ABID83_03410, partial [Candidatus Omnitrophota bacterium]
ALDILEDMRGENKGVYITTEKDEKGVSKFVCRTETNAPVTATRYAETLNQALGQLNDITVLDKPEYSEHQRDLLQEMKDYIGNNRIDNNRIYVETADNLNADSAEYSIDGEGSWIWWGTGGRNLPSKERKVVVFNSRFIDFLSGKRGTEEEEGALIMLAERLFHETMHVIHDSDGEVEQILRDRLFYKARLEGRPELAVVKRIADSEFKVDDTGQTGSFGAFFGTNTRFEMIHRISGMTDEGEISRAIRTYLEETNRRNSSAERLRLSDRQVRYARHILGILGISGELFESRISTINAAGEQSDDMSFFDFLRAHCLFTNIPPVHFDSDVDKERANEFDEFFSPDRRTREGRIIRGRIRKGKTVEKIIEIIRGSAQQARTVGETENRIRGLRRGGVVHYEGLKHLLKWALRIKHPHIHEKITGKLFGRIHYEGLNLLTLPILPVDNEGRIVERVERIFGWARTHRGAPRIDRLPPEEYFKARRISLYEYLITHEDEVSRFSPDGSSRPGDVEPEQLGLFDGESRDEKIDHMIGFGGPPLSFEALEISKIVNRVGMYITVETEKIGPPGKEKEVSKFVCKTVKKDPLAEVVQLLKKGPLSWEDVTKEAKLRIVKKLAERLEERKHPAALTKSDFQKNIRDFGENNLRGLLEWAKTRYNCKDDDEAVEKLKKYLGIKETMAPLAWELVEMLTQAFDLLNTIKDQDDDRSYSVLVNILERMKGQAKKANIQVKTAHNLNANSAYYENQRALVFNHRFISALYRFWVANRQKHYEGAEQSKILSKQFGAQRMVAERLFHEIDHRADEVDQILDDLELYRYFKKKYPKFQEYAALDAYAEIDMEGVGKDSLDRFFGNYFGSNAYFFMIWRISKTSDEMEKESKEEAKEKKKKKILKTIIRYLERTNRENSGAKFLKLDPEQIKYIEDFLKSHGIKDDLFGEKIVGISMFDFFNIHRLFTGRSRVKLFDRIHYKGLNLLTVPVFPVDNKGEIVWELFEWAYAAKNAEPSNRVPPKKYFKAKKISLYEYSITHRNEIYKTAAENGKKEVSRDGEGQDIVEKGISEIHRLSDEIDQSGAMGKTTHILIDSGIPAASQQNLTKYIDQKFRDDDYVLEKIRFMDPESIKDYLKENKCDKENTVVFLGDPKKAEGINFDGKIFMIEKEASADFVNLEALIGLARAILNLDRNSFLEIYSRLTGKPFELEDGKLDDLAKLPQIISLMLPRVSVIDVDKLKKYNDMLEENILIRA